MLKTGSLLDRLREDCFDLVQERYRSFKHCRYLDARLELTELRQAIVKDGSPFLCVDEAVFTLGIRALAGRTMAAPGYCGTIISLRNINSAMAAVDEALETAYGRAAANAKAKEHARKAWGAMGSSLAGTGLAPVAVYQDTIPAIFGEDPRSVPMRRVLDTSMGISRRIREIPEIRFELVDVRAAKQRMLFLSSEGAKIDQSLPLVEGSFYVLSSAAEGPPEAHYDTIGDYRGWEAVSGANPYGKTFEEFARALTLETVELSRAPLLELPEGKDAVIVTDPHFNALLVHEIVGHPSEADRALKWEAAYAGRTWFFTSPDRNMLGKRIASSHVSASSDATLPGYGHFRYDSEGVKARKVVHIENGIFRAFLNSRETAFILGGEPMGAMRSEDSSLVPLIRMTNTFFEPGQAEPEKILGEVSEGYLLEGHRTPSISESRENFRISARKTWRIADGKKVELFRGGSIMSDSGAYLLSIDAVGNDWRLYPVPNCGKGQPMQIMRVGNGGPTMRGRAKITGGAR